jgi:hypothetical protein
MNLSAARAKIMDEFSEGRKRPLTWLAKKLFSVCENPFQAGLFAFCFYALFSAYGGHFLGTTEYNYYNYLADALMHGQLHLRLEPNSTHDLIFYEGRYYLYWPPLPAFLVMPFVAIFGVSFSDVFFAILVGAVNVGLVAQLLRKLNERGLTNLDPYKRGLLVFVFGFGSVHLTQPPIGTVWAVSQLTGLAFVILAYLAVLSLRGWRVFVLAGLSIGLALASRNSLLFAGLWPAYFLLSQYRSYPWKKFVLYILLGGLPVIAIGTLFGLYNLARFNSFTDIGFAYHQMGVYFRDEYNQYGAFNLYYLPRNFYYQWIAYPYFARDTLERVMGGSLFLLTPIFFAVFTAFKKREFRWHSAMLVLAILVSYIPIGLLMGTGLIQFGPRYLLDLTTPVIILTAMGLEKWPLRVTTILAAISFIHYFFGLMFMMKG